MTMQLSRLLKPRADAKHREPRRNSVKVLNKDGHTIGLDIGATAIRAAVLTPTVVDGRPAVLAESMGRIELASGIVVNGIVQQPDELTAALKQLWRRGKLRSRNVVLGIANQQVIVRDLTIPDLNAEQRAKALPFQAQKIVALPIEQVILDFCQLGVADAETNMVRGLLLATPREPVLDAVSAVEKAGLKVARVDLSAFGTLRAIADDQVGVEAIIDLGAHLTTVVIHDHGVPRLVRTLARGGQEITDKIADRMGVGRHEAEAIKLDIDGATIGEDVARTLTEALRPLLAEIRTSIQYYRTMSDGGSIERISLTGGGSGLAGIVAAFDRQIGVPTRVVDPMQHVRGVQKPPDGVTAAPSAVSIGLAMGTAS